MTTTESPPPPQAPEQDSTHPRRAPPASTTEFLVVLSFAVLPSLLGSVLSYLSFDPGTDSAKPATATVMFARYLPQAAARCIPMLYIAYLHRGTWQDLGLVRPKWRDPLLAIPIYIVSMVASYVAVYAVYAANPSLAGGTEQRIANAIPVAHSTIDMIALLLMSIAIGFSEELLFRGYIISRWKALSGSAGQAVLVSSVLFAMLHTYQGLLGIVSSGIVGLVFATAFIFFRRLWPFAIAHAAIDALSFLARR